MLSKNQKQTKKRRNESSHIRWLKQTFPISQMTKYAAKFEEA